MLTGVTLQGSGGPIRGRAVPRATATFCRPASPKMPAPSGPAQHQSVSTQHIAHPDFRGGDGGAGPEGEMSPEGAGAGQRGRAASGGSAKL